MKKFKKIIAVLTGVVCMGSLITAVGCDDGDNKGTTNHEHTYATEWSYDETNHWHAATCEHTTETKDKAEHSFSGSKCSVCNYTKQEKTVEYNVTFDLNYSGATNAEPTKVKKDETVAKPADNPEQSGQIFLGWYTAAEGGAAYDFNTAVTGDLVLYAHWAPEDATLYTVTFNLNYEGASDVAPVKVEEDTTVKAIDFDGKMKISSEDGKWSHVFSTAEFEGWYTEAECINEYDFDTPVTEDVNLYAKWSEGEKTYTFEAELVNLKGKNGFGYSVDKYNEQLIRYDNEDLNQNASFGHSIGYLYQEDLSIEFEIYSDRDVDNVTLTARLSAEFRDVYIAPEQTWDEVDDTIKYCDFWFKVNGTSLDYAPIKLEGAKPTGASDQRPFSDHVISTTVSLKKGKNVIQLYVANSEFFESTITAMAPMIDCLYLSTDATLSWQPVWANMDKVETDVV